ncbi:MAG: alpha/beta fold hydrolase, partial [Chitinophagales bacterium]
QYNLLVVDLPGHGRNKDRDLNIPDYSFEVIAKKVWEVVDSLQIASIHLVGISLGTILCLQMRLLEPKRVLSLILPGAIVRLNTKLRVLASISLTLAKIIGYRNFYKLSAYIMMPRGNHKHSRDIFIKESKALTVAEFKRWTNLYYHLNETLNTFFEAKSTIPHLLIMGSQDHLFLPPAKSYATLHPNGTLSVIQNCGHVVSIEQAEKFNTICLDFLNTLQKITPEDSLSGEGIGG